jgi:serine/threonine protein kinase
MWPVYKVLTEKYRVKEVEARMLSTFLMRMFRWTPKKRASARELLDDPWLKVGPLDENTHMSKTYCNEWRRARGDSFSSSGSDDSESSLESMEEETDSEPNSGESLEEEEEVSNDDADDEIGTQNQTLMNTVPNVTGLNYNPK